MPVRRSAFLIATMAAATLSLAGAGIAMADAGGSETSAAGAPSTSSSSSASSTTNSTSQSPAVTSTKSPVDTKAPVTVVPKPVTEMPKPTTEGPRPATEAPTTPAPTCSDASSCVTTPDEQELPEESTCADTPAAAACVPVAAAGQVPNAPGGGDAQLPFTGPGDVILAIVLALLAGSGGVLFMFGASGREQLDTLNRRGMDSPSGFHLAYRELRKDQLDR